MKGVGGVFYAATSTHLFLFSVLCMSFNSETCHSYMKVRDTSKTTQFTWHNLLFNWHQHLYWKSIIISMLKYFNKKSYSTEQVCFYQMNKILLTFVIETIIQSQGKKCWNSYGIKYLYQVTRTTLLVQVSLQKKTA